MAHEKLDDTLRERGARYGDFTDNAEIAQATKWVWHGSKGWNNLTPVQREALDLIAMKISRILTGDPTHVDNFLDIAGYATLAGEHTRKSNERLKNDL